MIPPKTIQAIGNQIAIVWEDGVESYFDMERLRALSPSAENVGEPDLLGHVHGGSCQTEFPGVMITKWESIGGYAVQFHFSDGHNTGLYTYDYLRRIWNNEGTGEA
jgi:DUF971 family protein